MRTWVRPQNMNLLVSAVAASVALLALVALLVYRTSVSQELRDQAMANCLSIESLKATLREGYEERREALLSRTDLDPTIRSSAVAYLRPADQTVRANPMLDREKGGTE